MIQANELRIGNYLIDQYGDKGKVVGINSDKEYKHNGQLFVGTATLYYDNFKGSIGRWIQTLKPIKLTEEILLKCGFKPYGNGKWHHDAISLHEADFIFNSKSDRVKYVHQLQNLFYALTNEELEVKL